MPRAFRSRFKATLLAAVLLLCCHAMSLRARAQPLTEPVQTLFDGNGLGDVAALAITADGQHIYAAGRGDRALVAFSRDGGSGRLRQIDTYHDTSGGVAGIGAAVRILLSSDEVILYVAGGDGIAVLQRDPNTGELELLQLLRASFGIPLDY